MLEKFYAVTQSASVYEISYDSNRMIVMEKIALKGNSSIKAGDLLGSDASPHQTVLSVTYDFGLQRYERLGSKRVDQVNTAVWGAGTSKLIGLFLEKKLALKCGKSKI